MLRQETTHKVVNTGDLQGAGILFSQIRSRQDGFKQPIFVPSGDDDKFSGGIGRCSSAVQ